MSQLRNSLNVLERIGVMDVILPFLLIFTLLYAILEKTKVLGTEKIGNAEVSKKSANALVAFVIAFIVVGTPQLIPSLNKFISYVAILMVLIILFVMVITIFYYNDKDDKFEYSKNMRSLLVGVAGVTVLVIFLFAFNFIDKITELIDKFKSLGSFNPETMGIVIMLVVLGGAIFFVVSPPKKSSEDKTSEKK
jgi:lysylphosphatidylglycerol synthetase-like protein (DUF2156 family)